MEHARPLLLLRVAGLPFERLGSIAPLRSASPTAELLRREELAAVTAVSLGDALFRAAGARDSAGDPDRAKSRAAILALRRDIHNDRSLRANDLDRARPDLSPELVAALGRRTKETEALVAVRRRCVEAIGEDLDAARRAIALAARDPLFEEGVWLSSRSLVEGLRGLARRIPETWGHKERHLAGKAFAFLVRFCTKTSPNGLFCATAVAAIVDGSAAVSGRAGVEHVDVLLSVAEARKVAACLGVDPALDAAIHPRPNPTLVEDVDGWTFWRPATLRDPDDDEVRSRVRDHDVVRAFLEETGTEGARTVPELLEFVSARCGIPRDDLDDFYRQLRDRGILIGEIEIPYNERRPLRFLADAAQRVDCEPPWLGAVLAIEERVGALPRLSSRLRMDEAERIFTAMEALPHRRPLEPDEAIRLDAASGLAVQLPAAVLDALQDGLKPYVRLFSAMYPERIYRSALAARFLGAFPADTDIGLLEIYHGLFEPEERERPPSFPEPDRVTRRSDGASEALEAMRRARTFFAEAARGVRRGEEVEITDGGLRRIVGDFPEPAWSCGVLFQIAAGGPEAVSRGDYRIVLSALFNGAGLALARFANLHGGDDTEANRVVAELRRGFAWAEREGAVVAELTYNHNARTANAGLRPSIFRHEIELPGEKASPGAVAIPLRELTVRWDSASGRFVIRWTRTGVEVVPVINSGVNPVGIISFLIDVGRQGQQPLGYFPGFEEAGVTHWPRFVCGRTVIFRERWTFGEGDWPAPVPGGRLLGEAEFFLELARWRRRHDLPRHVFVHSVAEPKPRYIDLDSPALIAQFQRAAAAEPASLRGSLQVTEMLPSPEELWIRTEEGRYATEFLVHMRGPAPGEPR